MVVSAVVLQYGQVCHTGSFVVNLISCGLSSSVSALISPVAEFSGSYSSCGLTFNGSYDGLSSSSSRSLDDSSVAFLASSFISCCCDGLTSLCSASLCFSRSGSVSLFSVMIQYVRNAPMDLFADL